MAGLAERGEGRSGALPHLWPGAAAGRDQVAQAAQTSESTRQRTSSQCLGRAGSIKGGLRVRGGPRGQNGGRRTPECDERLRHMLVGPPEQAGRQPAAATLQSVSPGTAVQRQPEEKLQEKLRNACGFSCGGGEAASSSPSQSSAPQGSSYAQSLTPVTPTTRGGRAGGANAPSRTPQAPSPATAAAHLHADLVSRVVENPPLQSTQPFETI